MAAKIKTLDSWKMKSFNFLKTKTKLLTSVYTLFLILKHPQTPWQNKTFIILIILYFLSPLDLGFKKQLLPHLEVQI